jgi:predicted deacylase
MANKEVTTYEVTDPSSDYTARIPVGLARGDDDGPALAVIGGVHGTEYAAQEATVEFWEEIDPVQIRGSVRVVLCADTAALEGHSAYVNPIDGKNLNRVWPGNPEGTLTERIAHTITKEVIEHSDAVIDVHGGEWDEDIDCFIITHRSGDAELDTRTLDLAMSLGFTYVEVTDSEGAVLGKGTGSGEAMAGGRPALTLEAGGAGLRERRFVDAHKYALRNALKHLGIVDGEPIWWDGKPVKLDHGILMKTTKGGLYQPAVSIGEWITEGEVFSRVLDYDGRVIEELSAPESGTVLDMIIARAIKPGGFGGKIGVL